MSCGSASAATHEALRSWKRYLTPMLRCQRGKCFRCHLRAPLNSVRARIVATAEDYRWSSCGERLGQETLSFLDSDPRCFPDDGDWTRHWHAYLHSAIPSDEWPLIRSAVQRG